MAAPAPALVVGMSILRGSNTPVRRFDDELSRLAYVKLAREELVDTEELASLGFLLAQVVHRLKLTSVMGNPFILHMSQLAAELVV